MPNKDVIFVSLENWDDIWRRNQFLCAEWIKYHPADTILFVEPARDVSNTIRSRRWHQLRGKRFRQPLPPSNIHCLRPLKILPNSFRLFQLLNQSHLQLQISRASNQLRLHHPLLWINAHQTHHLVSKIPHCGVIYDITDDWTVFGSPRERATTKADDARLCQLADGIIVCSERLWELKSDLAHKLALIPNGVDAAHYSKVLDAPCPPQAASRWKRPILGYVGTIHEERIDLLLLKQLAEMLHTGSIVLIGPNHLSTEQEREITSLGNVHLHGQIPYQEVPDYMSAFDVCVVPHLVSSFTESLNPIKLWEYLAAGKPIVSTNVAGFRDFSDHVLIAEDAVAFYSACLRALNENTEAATARRITAKQHSWGQRLHQVEDFLCSLDLLPPNEKKEMLLKAP